LFFFDLSTMSGSTGLLYVGAIVAFFGIIFYVLIQKLLSKPIDFSKQKKEEKSAKKVSGFGATATSGDKTASGKKKN
jgi:hypothetical protein